MQFMLTTEIKVNHRVSLSTAQSFTEKNSVQLCEYDSLKLCG